MLLLAIGLCGASAEARKFYVSSTSGSDTAPGTVEDPWKTIARVNAQFLKPGDAVVLRRGDIWLETLRPRSSGTSSRPIVFSAYGVGHRPILRGNSTPGHDVNIDNNERSYLVYRELELQGARQGLRLYAWRAKVRGITLEDSTISTQARAPHGMMSAGVYASVGSGSISNLTIRRNEFYPYRTGPEHWGVYFVKGVRNFRIEFNVFAPAGEDAICVWHSARGFIAHNHGGGNGENTIDVKDSLDVIISGNIAENDSEYNIVVHRVDPGASAQHVTITQNQCRRGGQGGRLTAGIALLFVEKTTVTENLIENPYGAGIYVRDASATSANSVSNNHVHGHSSPSLAGVVLEDAPGTRVGENHSFPQVSTRH